MGQIYYDFAQGLNFIDPNGFIYHNILGWNYNSDKRNKSDINPLKNSRRIGPEGIILFGNSQHLGNRPLRLQ